MRRPVAFLPWALLWALVWGTSGAATQTADRRLSATATGTGGAAATADPLATDTALDVLDSGGNAVDAAVAAAAVLGVTEPFSCGVGGGGFLVAWLAGDEPGRSVTIDSRERAPERFPPDVFLDPDTGAPYPRDELVTSGLGVGVPGAVAGWDRALRRYGTLSLADALAPAIAVARHGFPVDQTFHDQIEANRERFAAFSSTSALYLPGGEPPPVGSVFTNPDLADTLERIARRGPGRFYRGAIADDIVAAVTAPPLAAGEARRVRPGRMDGGDLRSYEPRERDALAVRYRDFDVVGMGPPSSGGTTVGEALQILEGFDLAGMSRGDALHRVLEASRLAYADRGAYVGDPDAVDVPTAGLVSDSFAAERRAAIGPEAGPAPAPPGDPYPHEGRARPAPAGPARTASAEGPSTTHLTVSDRSGNVVSYTYTIEEIGGSGIVVPGRGFLLNNQLTDFEPQPPHPNEPGPDKRPRSSMSPTIVLRDGRPVLALGSPGGATIITTVLQLLVDVLDFGRPLPAAMAAPRVSQRNGAESSAEPGFVDSREAGYLQGLGHRFALRPELGAGTGIAFGAGAAVQAVAEPVRRGGGSAGVQEPFAAR